MLSAQPVDQTRNHSIVLDELVFKPDCNQMIKKMHLSESRPETDRFRFLEEAYENEGC